MSLSVTRRRGSEAASSGVGRRPARVVIPAEGWNVPLPRVEVDVELPEKRGRGAGCVPGFVPGFVFV